MITALGPRLGLGLRLDFGSQVWFVQYFSEKKVIVVAPLWLALKFNMAHGTACRPRALQLGRNMTVQYL